MIELDYPGQQASETGQPGITPDQVNPGFMDTFESGLASGYDNTSIGEFGDWLHRKVAGTKFADQPDMPEDTFKAEHPNLKYQKGMTPQLADVLQSQYDDKEKQAYYAEHGSGTATFLGSAIGQLADPLYAIPYVGIASKALKLGETAMRAAEFTRTADILAGATKEYAVGGTRLTGALTQASNASLAYMAEQPLAASNQDALYGQYDRDAAVQGLLTVFLGGGVFGSIFHKIPINEKIAGVNDAIDQMVNAKPVDVSQSVNSRAGAADLVPQALRAGGDLPLAKDLESVPKLHQRAVGIAMRQKEGETISVDDERLLNSVKEDGGVSYLADKLKRADEPRPSVAMPNRPAALMFEDADKLGPEGLKEAQAMAAKHGLQLSPTGSGIAGEFTIETGGKDVEPQIKAFQKEWESSHPDVNYTTGAVGERRGIATPEQKADWAQQLSQLMKEPSWEPHGEAIQPIPKIEEKPLTVKPEAAPEAVDMEGLEAHERAPIEAMMKESEHISGMAKALEMGAKCYG